MISLDMILLSLCRRFDEGTDVPSICAVYHVGKDWM